MADILFLKATTTKTITVPGYTKRNGTYVPPHQKIVHFDPDKTAGHVLSGRGSHSQKQALKKLSNKTGWTSLPEDEKHAHVLSLATDLQKQASLSAAVSGWKSSLTSDKKPTAAQDKAFIEMSGSDPVKAAKVMQSVVDAIGHEKVVKLVSSDALVALSLALHKKNNDLTQAVDHAVDHLKDDTNQADIPAKEHAEDKALVDKLETATDKPAVNEPAAVAPAHGVAFSSDQAKPASSKVLYMSHDADANTVAKVYKNDDGKYAVTLTDLDSGETLPTVKKFDTAPQAVTHAKLLTGNHSGASTAPKTAHDFQIDQTFKFDTALHGMNAGNGLWKVYNVSPDGEVVYLKKPGAKTPNSTNSKAVPADILAMALKNKSIVPHDAGAASADDSPKDGDTRPAADGGTLVFKDGRWHKEPGDDAAGTANMEVFTNTTAGHNKFWSIGNVEGTGTVVLHYGKIGTKGNVLVKHFATESAAAHYKLTMKKAKKANGYTKHSDVDAEFNGVTLAGYPEPKSAKDEMAEMLAQKKEPTVAPSPAVAPSAGAKVAGIPWDSVKLPESNVNSKSHNGAVEKIKAMADAADVSGLQAFIDKKADAKQTYAKKQVVLAKLALAALAEDGVSTATVSPTTAADTGPKDGDTKRGADGMLVFKDGHWHKVEEDELFNDNWEIDAGAKKGDQGMNVLSSADSAGNFMHFFYDPDSGSWSFQKNSIDDDDSINSFEAESPEDALYQFKEAFGPEDAPSLSQIKALNLDEPGDSPAPANAAAAPKPKKAADVIKQVPAVESVDDWKIVGGQSGSNDAALYEDPSGHKWYVKTLSSPEAAKNEVLASKLYAAAGIDVPDLKIVTRNGKTSVASKWVDGLKQVKDPDALSMAKGVSSGFVADAWLANWDVAGLGYDNLLVKPNGQAVRVDLGGSLLFRAQGSPKGDAFTDSVPELETLKDPGKNSFAAALFNGMSKASITASAKRVLKISDDEIKDLCSEYGPGSSTDRAALAQKLIARKNAIAEAFPTASAEPKKKKLDPSKLPVNPKDLPPYHDFMNWNGPGKGLSSKDHINEANLQAEKDLHDFALKGNLTALKDYKFTAVDKETGASLGLKPINEHPSQHVKLYHSDLVAFLDMIANPPEPLKVSSGNNPATFGAEKLGTTIDHVAANKKLGFWIGLGKIKKALPFINHFVGKEKHVSTAARNAAFAKYKSLPKLTRHFISRVQASGSYNDLFRDGKASDYDGNSTVAIAKSVYDSAETKPVGTTIYKWINMPEKMVQQLMGTDPGLVFQNPGSMCCSMDPTMTSGFGQHRLVIHYAEGAKAVDSFSSGKFKGSEDEITTLMGQRFMLLKCEKVNGIGGTHKNGVDVHLMMLPPDPEYIDDLAKRVASGGSMAKSAPLVFSLFNRIFRGGRNEQL